MKSVKVLIVASVFLFAGIIMLGYGFNNFLNGFIELNNEKVGSYISSAMVGVIGMLIMIMGIVVLTTNGKVIEETNNKRHKV